MSHWKLHSLQYLNKSIRFQALLNRESADAEAPQPADPEKTIAFFCKKKSNQLDKNETEMLNAVWNFIFGYKEGYPKNDVSLTSLTFN